MCGAFRGRDRNRIVPVTDLSSERIEIRKDRWLRVIHYKPRLSRSDSGFGREDVQSIHAVNSISSENVVRDSEYKRIVAIFFIHGVGGCADLWYEQLEYFFKAGYEVLAPDLLGHGRSSAPRNPADYSFSELSNDLLNLFDRYHKKKNVLVGHSYGASFCSVIASERPCLVSKMVLIAGGGPVPLVGIHPCDVFCLPTPVLYCIRPMFLSVYERRAYNSKRARSIRREIKAFSAPPYVLKAVMAGQRWEEGDEAYHQELLAPALLIYGAEDKFVTLAEEQWMQEVIYSSSLEVIQDAGHMVMVESPKRVNWLIHNFLQRDGTSRSTDDSSKGSLHVTKATDLIKAESHKTAADGFNEQVRRCSSGLSIEPYLEQNTEDTRKGSRSPLTVPVNDHSRRRSSADEVKELHLLQQERKETCLEIPQSKERSRKLSFADTVNSLKQASNVGGHDLDNSLPLDKAEPKEESVN